MPAQICRNVCSQKCLDPGDAGCCLLSRHRHCHLKHGRSCVGDPGAKGGCGSRAIKAHCIRICTWMTDVCKALVQKMHPALSFRDDDKVPAGAKIQLHKESRLVVEVAGAKIQLHKESRLVVKVTHGYVVEVGEVLLIEIMVGTGFLSEISVVTHPVKCRVLSAIIVVVSGSF